MRRDHGASSRAIDMQADGEVAGRQIRPCPVGPFDQTESRIGEVFVQTCIEKFFLKVEPIKIKVIQV